MTREERNVVRIEVSRLVVVHRGGQRALDEVDLTLSGGLVGLVGPNGAGKTTLVRTLTGLVRPTSGSVHVGGHDLATAAGRRQVRHLLGYLPQDFDPYSELTGREFLDYLALLKHIDSRRARRAQIEDLLERTGLTGVADQRVGRYSTGTRRRLGIAQALLGDPRLVIVDEPTANLDPEERMRFRGLLATLAGDRTVLLATHILGDVAQTCPESVVLAGGRVVYHGATAELTEQARGRTYTVTAATPPTPEVGVVVNAWAADGVMRYRVAGGTPPEGVTVEEPTLEDGYAALMHTVRGTART